MITNYKTEVRLSEIDLDSIKADLSFEGNLDDEDAFDSFNNYYGETYICDAISEISDRCVNIYTGDLWRDAKYNEEYIRQALSDGLVDTGRDFSLIRLFQAGEYEYYTACLYANLSELCYNYALDSIKDYQIVIEARQEISGRDLEVMQEKLLELIEDSFNDIDGDGNYKFSDIESIAYGLLDEAVENLIDEFKDEFEDFTISILIE